MSKVGGSYDSVVLGVSEQVAHDRRPGQHGEQINYISDPVKGLVRRRGSVWQDEIDLGVGTLATYGDEAAAMREYTFVIDGTEYSVLYRADTSAHDEEKFMYLYNKTTDEFIPIEYEGSTWVNDLISGGVSAITNVGRYLYIAGNDNVPDYTVEDKWGTEANLSRLVAWVRGGAYSRTFSLTLTKDDNTTIDVSYKTKPSAYPVLNDTSVIDFYEMDGTTPRPDYQKDINDANALYNSNVTKYIGEAAEDITGENIAQKLVDALVLAGVTATRIDSSVVIEDTSIVDVSGDDGGDNTLMRAVGKEVSAPTLMSVLHYVGKVVRIRPQGSSDKEAYYLEAFAKDDVSTGWTEVIWRESAGVLQTPDNMFAQAVIHEGTMYVAQDGPGLLALAPTSGPHPDMKANVVGDAVSSPVPEFFGKTITLLTTFQDRLIVGSGGTINASKPGDYLNFFRSTILNVQDDDPIEVFAYGAEGDVLRYAVMFDADLVIFGDLKQYGITGKQVFSAKSPNIRTIGAHEGATATSPIASGNFVFYGKSSEGRTSMHQLQIGPGLVESPISFDVSSQLDTYLNGSPAQLVAITSPNMVMLRTEQAFYTYAYLDNGNNERVFDSWSRWRFNSVLGRVIGTTTYKGEVLVFTMRQGTTNLYVVADKINLGSTLSNLPYADSLRPLADLTGWHAAATPGLMIAAADATTPYFLLGSPLDTVDDLIAQLPEIEDALWVGAYDDAEVEPTNPYRRDQNGKAVLAGRLTLNQVKASVVDTGGCNARVDTVNGGVATLAFEGRLLGRTSLLIARQPLVTTQATVGIGKEVRECKYTIKSETWLPIRITAIEWTGQYFNRVRRA